MGDGFTAETAIKWTVNTAAYHITYILPSEQIDSCDTVHKHKATQICVCFYQLFGTVSENLIFTVMLSADIMDLCQMFTSLADIVH